MSDNGKYLWQFDKIQFLISRTIANTDVELGIKVLDKQESLRTLRIPSAQASPSDSHKHLSLPDVEQTLHR